MISNLIGSLTNSNQYKVSKLKPILEKVNQLDQKYGAFTDEELKAQILSYKNDLREKELSKDERTRKLNDILPDVYAITRHAAHRTMNQKHRDVQVLGGIVLHQGKIAEQKTGEGKTLTATLPLVLNSLTGLGAHLITPNDYLSKHGAGWYGPVYHFLGLTVGVIIDHESFIFDSNYTVENVIDDYTKHLKPVHRRVAYMADVTYGTGSAFGFDYLRDNMASAQNGIVHSNPLEKLGAHSFAIVDEVDSVLIDVARTPLIISQPQDIRAEAYYKFAQLAAGLVQSTDYTLDEKDKIVTLTELGINKIERKLSVNNLYENDFDTVHHIENALRAKEFYLKDRDYVIREGEILIVDQNTGRVLQGNKWSRGLHQAVEAKEGLQIGADSETVATVSYQNFFRLYEKLSGMTGTAETEAEEFFKIYGLDVVSIPTNKPVARVDRADIVFKTETGKYKAIAADISERHKRGQPVLIGTVSVEKSELLSKYLKRLNIEHEILNAKHHDREALVIRQAGQKGSVTVATNMAGRGVDIILGGDPFNKEQFDEVVALGGLYVIGTERHDSRRIDNQLRGRSGRQGEVGESRFYLSLQDDLMRIFGGETIENIMNKLGLAEDTPIEAKMISRSIENAQKKVEGMNFDRRRSLVEYDDVMNVQRETIYNVRRKILFAEFADVDSFYVWLEGKISAYLSYDFNDLMEKRSKEHSPELWFEVTKKLSLEVVDFLWTDHIDTMDDLRSEVGLRGYGQVDPIIEYKREGKQLFDTLLAEAWTNIVDRLQNVKVEVTNIKPAPQSPYQIDGQLDQAGSIETGVQNEIVDLAEMKNIGRNDPCPCGSGKKYKKCHGKDK